MKLHTMALLAGAALSAAALQASAQPTQLDLHEMNFDMWCQEHEHLPPARCDKRLPKDDAAFQAYVNLIENYETQKLNNEAKERHIDRMLETNPASAPPQPPAPRPQ